MVQRLLIINNDLITSAYFIEFKFYSDRLIMPTEMSSARISWIESDNIVSFFFVRSGIKLIYLNPDCVSIQT